MKLYDTTHVGFNAKKASALYRCSPRKEDVPDPQIATPKYDKVDGPRRSFCAGTGINAHVDFALDRFGIAAGSRAGDQHDRYRSDGLRNPTGRPYGRPRYRAGWLEVPCTGTVVIDLASPRPLRLWIGDLPLLDRTFGGGASSASCASL